MAKRCRGTDGVGRVSTVRPTDGVGRVSTVRPKDSVGCVNCPSDRRFPLSDYRVLLEKLTVPQPVKELLAFYAIRTFLAVITTAPHPVPLPCHSNPLNALSPLLKILSNTILPFNTGSSKLHLSESFPHLNTVYISHPHPYVPHVPPITFVLILSPKSHFVNSNDLAVFITQFSSGPGRSSPFGPIYSETPFSL
jgi:hypothetical protein